MTVRNHQVTGRAQKTPCGQTYRKSAWSPGQTQAKLLEKRFFFGRGADVSAAKLRHDSPAGSALQESELEQIRLVDVLDRVRLLAKGDGQRGQAHRAAVEALDDRLQKLAIGALESVAVDLEQLESLGRDLGRDLALVAHLGDVANPAQDPVRDARCAPGARGDLVGGFVGDLYPENPGRAS